MAKAKRLTEEMVIARSKISDLSKVKRLNCWGSELEDVSLLQQMSNVEVLSLSINKISTLADFQYCHALQELYIRQNNISDLNQICYLQNLRNLKNLWLGENPCANVEGYRLSVLKILPHLQKLDNVSVTQEELKEAARKGKSLVHPEDAQDTEEEEYVPQQQYQRYQEYPTEAVYSSQSSPTQHERSPPRRDESVRQSYSPDQDYGDRKTSTYEQECPRNINFYDEYTNGDRYNYSQQYRQSEGSEISNSHSHEVLPRKERYVCSATHQPPFNRRPVARNSNILSAVLCLVKELDYPSLEVVEMAVRCRMNELEE